MKTGDKLFVRIDHKVTENQVKSTDFSDHITYLKNASTERFFMGGGFANKVGGMIVYKAKDFKEAKKIADNDPLIQRNLYTYELLEWDLVVLSDTQNDNLDT